MHCQIVGGGLLGLTSAWFLRKLGHEVSLYEKDEEVGLGTSFANGGMLHASEANPWNHPGIFWQALKMLGREDSALLIRPYAVAGMLPWIFSFFTNSSAGRFKKNLAKNACLAQFSIEMLKDEFLPLGLDFDCRQVGTLKIYSNSSALITASDLAEEASVMGVRHVTLNRSELLELEPSLVGAKGELIGGIHYPDDISGDAYSFCKALSRACVESGIDIRLSSPVDEILVREGKFGGLRVNNEMVSGDVCVLAAGCGTKALARRLKIKVPLEPVKGYSITVDAKDWRIKPRMPIIDESRHAAVCPLGSRLRIAGTAEFAGFNSDMVPARIDNLSGVCEALFPFTKNIARDSDVSPWFGYRPMTSDGVGIIGGTDLQGLFLNTGHGHLGWTMAPGSGKLIADIISDNPTVLSKADYLLSRF